MATMSEATKTHHGGATRGAATLALVLAPACGGGGSSTPGDDVPWWEEIDQSPAFPADDAEAVRFLTQATFGPSKSEIAELRTVGYDAWLVEQFTLPASLHRPALDAFEAAGATLTQDHRLRRWWQLAIEAPDQLRQRVAYCLSQVLVVSDVDGNLLIDPKGLAEYQDLLVRGAFGTYRELLEDVTLSGVMGRYLSMVKNQKPIPQFGIRPDENYAREVLQLFSIGLWELNADGSQRLDGLGQPIPTYDQAEVEALAHVFTGWNFASAPTWLAWTPDLDPMEPWAAYHDTGTKQLFGGHVLPAGQSAQADLDQTLDLIAAHPNVGPFLGRQLIQRLVTSNPTPGYVARVAAVFADDGTGQRGNLGAVVRAILLDGEARNGPTTVGATFGKLREPILRQAALWRTFDARPPDGQYNLPNEQFNFGQAPLRSDSVFNFYEPGYLPPGEMGAAGLAGPEFQITSHEFVTATTNRLHDLTQKFWLGSDDDNTTVPRIDVSAEALLAEDPAALVERLDVLLTGGGLSAAAKELLADHLASVPLDYNGTPHGVQRTLEGLFMICTTPEGAIQR
jgi:uncharacterized protein (DUF1800 family)